MFRGSLVAIVTPMTADGGLDWPAWDRLLDFHVREGTDGIVVAGTTGESPALALEEIEELTRRAVARCSGKAQGDRRRRHQLDREHRGPHARAVEAGRRWRHAGDALLQQAAAGRPVPALHGGRGGLGGAGDALQRAEPHRGGSAAGHHRAAGAASADRGGQGCERIAGPGARIAGGLSAGVHGAVRRRCDARSSGSAPARAASYR